MNLDLLYHPLVEALGAALMHSLWQGALVATGLYIALRIVKKGDSGTRYALCCATLLLLFLLPVSTGVHIYLSSQPDPASFPFSEATAVYQAPSMETAPVPNEATGTPSIAQHAGEDAIASSIAWRPFLVAFWFMGVVVLSLRWINSLVGVHQLKRYGLAVEDESIQFSFDSLAVQLGISRSVQLLASVHIDQPIVIGWLKPVVLLPLSVVTNLPLTHLEAILAHELAHVRRHDYLVLVCQSVVEVLFFYHPAVWWVSRQMRIEREYCTDELATRVLDNELVYVMALANLDSRRGEQLVLGATDGRLVDRIRRIVQRKNVVAQQRTSWLGVGLLIASCGFLATACMNWGEPGLDGTPEELYEAAVEKVKDHNFMTAKTYLEKAAEQGDMCSMQLLVELYRPKSERHYFSDGTAVRNVKWGAEDEEVAMNWAEAYAHVLQERANGGDSNAMVWLYLLQGSVWKFSPFMTGGLAHDDSLADMWLERAFEAGDKYAIRHKAVRAIRDDGNFEEGDRLFAEAAALGDEGAYYWWAITDTFPTPDRYFKPIDLAITNKAEGTYHWVKDMMEGIDRQIAAGNEHTIPWKEMADSLQIAERLEAFSDDQSIPGSHVFPEFRSLCQPVDPAWFYEKPKR